MTWRTARIVLKKELRETLRDPLVLVNAIVFPLVLLPLVLWGATQFALLQAGVAEQEPPRVALAGEWPEALRGPLLEAPVVPTEPPAAVDDALRDGALDAVLRIETEGEAWTIEIAHDSTRTRSARARRLIAERVETLRADRLARLAEARGLDLARLAPRPIEAEDISAGAEKWGELLGEMLPIMVFVALMMAVVFPAVDTVAGERERGTVETTLVTAAAPVGVALGKMGAVLAIGLFAMAGNALAMGLTMVQFVVTLGADDLGELRLSPASLLLAVPPLVATALAIVAAAVAVVLPARSFKEGQQRASYLMFAGFIGAFYAQSETAALDLVGALNPLTSPIAVVRDAVRGDLGVGPALVATAAQLALAAALAVWVARRLRDESYLLGAPAADDDTTAKARGWLQRLGLGRKEEP